MCWFGWLGLGTLVDPSFLPVRLFAWRLLGFLVADVDVPSITAAKFDVNVVLASSSPSDLVVHDGLAQRCRMSVEQ